MNRFLTKRVFPVILLLSARSVFATDGQVLISQASVMASGGFPYRITAPGSYKLSGNLVGSLNAVVVQIESNDVVLDLNGFNVRCSFTPASGFNSGACISDAGKPLNSVTIRNGSVTATAIAPTFQVGQNVAGINLLSSQATTIEDLHFSGEVTNYSVNGLESGRYSIVRRNIFSNGAGPDIACPSVLESNVNQTGGAGSSGTGCASIGNVGLFL